MADESKTPSLARNLLSSLGLIIAIIALINIAFLVFADLGSSHANPYVGIFAYVVLPGVLCFGLLLFLAGILRERARRRRHAPEEVQKYPDIDLNDTHTRHTVEWSIIGISVFALISIVGSYRAYHYTDSDAFCGTTCHQVMHPEYTAYKASPHARVGCVNCHIGSGATWYVKSKLSGAYQVYSTIAQKYPRPIPSPVHNLRPAQETCEQCHWPEKFWGGQLKSFNHFAYDEANTPQETRMLIKVGGGSPINGPTTGIHWHMNIQNEVTYVTTDDKRQTIEWVRIRNRKTGKMTEYKAEDSKLTPQQIEAAPKRTMDCVDCHNRPTHIYQPPDRAVDRALLTQDIKPDLPYIKQQGVTVLAKDYTSTDQAMKAIATEIPNYYRASYPAVYTSRKADIDAAVAELQSIFKTIRFPEMKVDWRTHPDNIGHYYYTGCFRCHDGQHVSADGRRINNDCTSCHEVIGKPDGQFEHPIDMGDLRLVKCAECHTGSAM